MATTIRLDLIRELENEFGSVMGVPESEPRLEAIRKSAMVKLPDKPKVAISTVKKTMTITLLSSLSLIKLPIVTY